jgi:Ni/Fe-hydrogenase 1 B-type cytochrome subunit
VEKIAPTKEWSAAMRWNHWLMALTILVLIATGFYIADPLTISGGETVDKFLMGEIRFWHILFGVILGALFIWRLYLSFFSRFHADWRDFSACLNRKNVFKQVCYYAFISKEPPEHTHLYGPLQALSYAGLLIMVFLIYLPGLVLMGTGYDAGLTALIYKIVKPLENWMGGLAMARWFHHILMWGFILFIPVHIYMAIWYDITFKEGTISSMVSGVVFRHSHD